MEVYVPDGQDTWVARYNEHTCFPIEEYAENRDFSGGGCIAVRRKVFEDVGRFDHRLVSGGDAEFGHRVAASGRDIRFTPETNVYHPARTSLRSQIKKEIRVVGGSASYNATIRIGTADRGFPRDRPGLTIRRQRRTSRY